MNPDPSEGKRGASEQAGIGARDFARRYHLLWVCAWLLAPGIGLAMLAFAQGLAPMRTLPPPLVIVACVFVLAGVGLGALLLRPPERALRAYLQAPSPARSEQAWAAMRQFPARYWSAFLSYVLLAPGVMVFVAYLHDLGAPMDWLQSQLTALVLSILVGLPVFLALLDLFGRAVARMALPAPLVSLQTKVFLVGALTPVLMATLLLQYHWALADAIDSESLLVWLAAVAVTLTGARLFSVSIARGLAPHGTMLEAAQAGEPVDADRLTPRSTDEFGVLAGGYQRMLRELRIHERILELNNRILQGHMDDSALGARIDEVLELVRAAIGDAQVFLVLHDKAANELVGVAHTGSHYNPVGHFRIRPDEVSTAARVFREGRGLTIHDARRDPRVGERLQDHAATQAMVAVPLRSEGATIGVLMSVNAERTRHYSRADMALLESLASEVALAVRTQLFFRERHQQEHVLKEREERLRVLLDCTGEAIYGLDLQGYCTFANPACVRMLGYESEEALLGADMHALIHHSHADGRPRPRERCAIRLAMLRQDSAHIDDEVYWRRDGTSFPVEYWSHPMYKDEDLVGTVVSFVDITARQRDQAELVRLAEYNRLLLESSGEGIFGVDRELRCSFVNRAAAEMLGYARDELLGQDVHALLNHSTEERVPLPREDSFMQQCLEDDQGLSSENEVLWHRNGNYIPVQLSANPIHENGVVCGAVVVFRNITEARAMARKMDYLATHDPLTGLVNRREFERRLQRAIDDSAGGRTEHALCYLDLDQFKIVNDTCGHVAGDELLRSLAVILKGRMRQTDTLARLGGDEFGVLLERCESADALRITGELRALVQDFRFAWDDKTFALGVSIGVVSIDGHAGDVATALSAADTACYMAKDAGRNRVHHFKPNDIELAQRQGEMQWIARIQRALDEQRLELACQRIVPVATDSDGRTHLEVLVRMRDEQGGVVPPGAFLPAAERYNLMPTVDRWIVGATLDALAGQPQALEQMEFCSINLSGNSVGEEDFLDFITARLASSGVPPEKICFEITETAAVANLTHAVAFISALREQGCRFALDDFGSGMSSFAYLKTLPVDFLKIDGNFVRDMTEDPIDRAMVSAINQVGHVMGIRTIAEFVENSGILGALRGIGVDYAQGMGIASPEPLRELLQLMSERVEAPLGVAAARRLR